MPSPDNLSSPTILTENTSPKKCGACLFPLPASISVLPFDVDTSEEDNDPFAMFDSLNVTISQVHESAQRKCLNCVAIHSYLVNTITDPVAIEWWPSMGDLRPRITAHTERGEDVELEICGPVPGLGEGGVNGTEYKNPCLSFGVKVVGGTGGEHALNLAGKWLKKCREGYEQCKKNADEKFVPTRLLFIGGDELDAVVLREGLKAVGYVALSHRWSIETEGVRLLKTNFEERWTVGIPLVNLPNMMRGAIDVVRKLGIDFIWIDSLCIIQDLREDWLKEAAMMAGVYLNAEFTVAATWCHGSGHSLFSDRDAAASEVVDLPGSELFLRRSAPHFEWENADEGTPMAERNLWPLLRRGWVYQEQWLSRRTIHFTEHELVWICNETTACECGRYDFDKANESSWAGGHLGTRSLEWTQIVQEYTGRAFTQIADRLPALAGIATEYLKLKDRGQYLCGHWRNELPESLFWKSSGRLMLRPDVKMPSWLWALVMGDIEFEYPSEDLQPEILDAEVVYYGTALMGDVAEALLRVSGLVVPARALYGEEWTERLAAQGITLLEEGYGFDIGGRLVTFRPDYLLHGNGALEESDD